MVLEEVVVGRLRWLNVVDIGLLRLVSLGLTFGMLKGSCCLSWLLGILCL